MNDKALPQWAADYMNQWKERLLLHEWNLKTKVVARPDEDTEAYATVSIYPDTRTAIIHVRDDIPDEYDADWEKTLIHELVHVRIGCLTDLVQRDLLPELSSAAQVVADRALRREVEAAVELLTGTLFELRGAA